SGLDLTTYTKYTGLTLDALREQFRPQAERQVKARLALEKIAALENLEATEEDINAEYQRIADAYNMPVEQVKESVPADAIEEDMRVKKAMDLVREKAVITDAAPAAAEAAEAPAAPKKKTTRKSTKKTADAAE
ncbi:MAG: trigger factor, partial [Clostridia bacterium]|nr:trigger factor [Clostridia bacterium]